MTAAGKRLCDSIFERGCGLQFGWLEVDEVAVHQPEERLCKHWSSWLRGCVTRTGNAAWMELLSVVVTLAMSRNSSLIHRNLPASEILAHREVFLFTWIVSRQGAYQPVLSESHTDNKKRTTSLRARSESDAGRHDFFKQATQGLGLADSHCKRCCLSPQCWVRGKDGFEGEGLWQCLPQGGLKIQELMCTTQR